MFGIRSIARGKGAQLRLRNEHSHRAFHHIEEHRPPHTRQRFLKYPAPRSHKGIIKDSNYKYL